MDNSISIREILQSIKKRWKLIVIITLSFTLLSAIISFFVIKPQYEGTVKLFIGKEESKDHGYNNSDVMMYQNLMKTYAEVIQTKDLVSNAMKVAKVNIESKDVINNLTVVPRADTQVLEIKFKSTSKEEVVQVLSALTNEFIYKANNLVKNGNVQIIQNVEMPQKPVSPNKALNIIIAFVLGIMVSLGIVFLIEYLDNTFKSNTDVEKHFNIPVVGVIPKVNSVG